MAGSNLANLFHDFCQLCYDIIDFFCVLLYCNRSQMTPQRVRTSSHAMTSSVIYYSTDARKNEIYLLSIIDYRMCLMYLYYDCVKHRPRILDMLLLLSVLLLEV